MTGGRAASGPHRAGRPLGAFVLLSAALHLLFFLRFTGPQPPVRTAPIAVELCLLEQTTPAEPQPATEPASEPPQPAPAPLPEPAPQPKPQPPEPRPSPAPEPVVEPKPATEPTPEPVAAPLPQAETLPLARKKPPAAPAPAAPKEATIPAGKERKRASALRASYFGMVRQRIERNRRYPAMAVRRRLTGRVTVRFVIEPDGSMHDLELTRASRHRLLNEAALAAVRASSPFPAPPAGVADRPIPLEISIVFELT